MADARMKSPTVGHLALDCARMACEPELPPAATRACFFTKYSCFRLAFSSLTRLGVRPTACILVLVLRTLPRLPDALLGILQSFLR